MLTGVTNQIAVDETVDHVRGPASAHVIIEYGDYECPYSRAGYREVQRAEQAADFRFVFRHFPLTQIHPHALASSAAAEAAALQGRFWEMHDLLFHRQKALGDDELRGYAGELGLNLERFEAEWRSGPVLARIARDVESGLGSGEVLGTPTFFIDGLVYRGSYDADALLEALRSPA
jgi:protein-disulfide isomerase